MYNSKINYYLARQFFFYLLTTSLAVLFILLISSIFDILQKFRSVNLGAIAFWQLSILKLPYLFNEVSSLVCFISTVIFFRKLSLTQELLAIVVGGMQLWKVFLVPLASSLLFGSFLLFIIGPVSTYGLLKYNKLEHQVSNIPENNITVGPNGIFFFETFDQHRRIIQADSIDIKNRSLKYLTIVNIDHDNNLLNRIEANNAILDNHKLILESAEYLFPDRKKIEEKLELKTSVLIENLIEKFTAPEYIYVWNLRAVINRFAKMGIVTLNYELYYYKQLFRPLVALAMTFMSCLFVSLNVRDASINKKATTAVVFGIFMFFAQEIIVRLLAHNLVYSVLASSAPVLIIIFISIYTILHQQDA